MPTFASNHLTDAITQAFVVCSVPEDGARIVAEHLVDAELSGVTSHGIIRVPQYVKALKAGHIALDAELTVTADQTGTAVLDGHGGLGQVMARRAMDIAIRKAAKCGVGATTLVNCSHTGRLAAYALQAAEASMIGVVMVNPGGHGQWVAPFGGIAGRLGTNPLSIAAPTGNDTPIFIDMATCVAPEGKVRAWMVAGKDLPDGWLRDPSGQPTNNPKDLYGPPRGALQPVGGHKGYGLALMIDLIAGALSGAGVCNDPNAPLDGKTDGVFLLAINVQSFCPLEHFYGLAGQLVSHVKSSPPASGFEEVLVAGELEGSCKAERLTSGIPVEEKTWATIQETLDELGVSV